MKNFKKTLIALAVLVLLVSSLAVMVVTANDDIAYTGSIAEAQALLDKVVDGQTIPDQAKLLKSFYAYITENPIDPATEGYAEFSASYNQKSLTLMNRYYAAVLKQTDNAKKIEKINETYSYAADCPIAADTPDPDGDGPYFSYADVLVELQKTNFEVLNLYLTDVKTNVSTDAAAAAKSLEVIYTQQATHPIDPAVIDGCEEFVLEYNTASVDIVEAYITAINAARESWAENEEDADAIKAYRNVLETSSLPNLLNHLKKCPVDTEKYVELKPRLDASDAHMDVFEVDRFVFLLKDYDNLDLEGVVNPETKKQTYLGKIQVLLNDAVIAEDTEGYAEFLESYSAKKKLADDAMEERRVTLDKQNSFTNYDLKILESNDFSTTPWKVTHADASGGKAEGKLLSDPNNPARDSYMSTLYYGTYDPAPYTYRSTAALKDISAGFVMQYDCMLTGLNGKHFTQTQVNFRNGSVSGMPFPLLYKFEYKNGAITATSGSGVVVPDVACEGDWFNVILTFDFETYTGKLYINYEYLFDVDYSTYQGTTGELRFQGNYANQSMNYDNYVLYQGTEYRDVNKMNITEEEAFLLYCDYFQDYSVIPQVRNESYVYAKNLIPTIEKIYEGKTEEELTDQEKEYQRLVQVIQNYNYEEEIVKPAKAENLVKIQALVDKLNAIEVKSSNITLLNDAVKAIENFISKNNDFIDKASAVYNAAISSTTKTKEDVMKCENAVVFAEALAQFGRATSLASMTKRYNTAKEIYELSKYSNQANIDFVANDPVIVSFEKKINGDVTADDPAYITAFEYYDSIPEIIAAQAKLENSKRLIDCMGFVDDIIEGEYTEEVYQANLEELTFYMDIMRSIISKDNYNCDVDGIDAVIEKFELIDEYFYKVLQDTHKDIISEQLEKFVNSNTYIEKVGICTYLRKYFEENDIDMSDPVFTEYLYYLDIYEGELEAHKVMYKDKLEENTQYFIAAVKKMDSVFTYAELKPLYDEALQYYYGMNVDSDDAKSAIDKFNAYEEKLALIKESSRLFADKAFYISLAQSSKDQDAIYNAIMDCMLYYQYADATYSSTMQESIDSYFEALDAYNEGADAINAEIEVAGAVVCAVRTNKISAAILAVINEIIKG